MDICSLLLLPSFNADNDAPPGALCTVSVTLSLSPAGFARMLERAAASAGLDSLKVHPHMLRHSCGYALANQGVDTRSLQAYLGHRHIQNTVRYAELSPTRFKGFWRDR